MTHLYIDAGVAAEHGYTGLSRARGETHLWVNTSRTIDGRCLQAHGAVEMPLDSLVRQLGRSVVQPPAIMEGLAIENASDRQLHQRLQDLESVIRSGPLGQPFDPEDLPRIADAIEEARAVAQRLRTSGARTYIEHLERERQQLVDHIENREEWVSDHANLLHTYTAIKDESAGRATALAISYQLNPPVDILEALGPRPSRSIDAKRWDTAVTHHAEARIRLGPEEDLTDPAVLEAASWRTAIQTYHVTLELGREPVLGLIG